MAARWRNREFAGRTALGAGSPPAPPSRPLTVILRHAKGTLMNRHTIASLLSLSCLIVACADDQTTAETIGATETAGDGDGDPTGDGDGDPTGDGDGDPTGDGDGDPTGDGDGDPTGDGDGDGDPTGDGDGDGDGGGDGDGDGDPTGDGDGDPTGDGDGDGDGPPIPETCEQALQGESTVGCLFYGVDLDTHDLVETSQFAIAVSNVQENQIATVSVERKQNGMWNVVGGPTMVQALDLHTFNLPDNHSDDSGVRVGGAYRVTSDVPIIAYQFNPVDGSTSYLSDASMLYPVTAWDHFNEVVGWVSTNDGSQQGAYTTVVAAYDGTVVEVIPSVATLGGPGVPAGQPGIPFQVMLDEGDTAEVMTKTQNVGLTGTQINSDEDHPIGVFSGQECAFIPANVYACDHLEDQLSGLRLWGEHFIASRMPVRGNPPESSLWQIYASEDGTTVTLNADAEVTGLPMGQLNMNSGDLVQFYASGTQAIPGDFEVTATKPIAIVNYMTGSLNLQGSDQGDPAMVQLSPVEQYLPRYVVLVPGTWINDYAVITREMDAEITIDGVPVPDQNFVPVADSMYEVARVSVSDGVHLIDGGIAKFSVVIVGYDSYDSYAYLGGTGTGIINPNPQ
jgi:hypothetical protein